MGLKEINSSRQRESGEVIYIEQGELEVFRINIGESKVIVFLKEKVNVDKRDVVRKTNKVCGGDTEFMEYVRVF